MSQEATIDSNSSLDANASLPEEYRWTEQFPYLADEKYPLLFLGFVIDNEKALSVRFKKPYKPVKIEHTTAGLRCDIYYLYGLLLKPKPEVYQNMLALCQKWRGSEVGYIVPNLDQILAYRQDIQRLFGFDCNRSFRDFGEAIYPMDLYSKEAYPAVSTLTSTPLPKNLGDLIKLPSTRMTRNQYPGVDWALLILGENLCEYKDDPLPEDNPPSAE